MARVVFHQKILPLLSNLKKNFTQFSIQDVAEFKSTYAHRIYQLMMQYKSTGYVKITIDDLKFMLMLGLKYALFADFKKRVLDVAIDEINGKSPYNVQYELIKKGRKFVAIELKFAPKVKEKPLSEPTRDQKTIDIFDNLTDQEHDIIAQKNVYADSIGATAEHRQNLIKQALKQHQDAIQAEQEAKQRKKAERQAQKEHEKQQLELARKQYEQILASDTLINAYIANNINPQKMRASLQKMRYEQGNFREVFRMEKYKFEQLHHLRYLNLKFLQ